MGNSSQQKSTTNLSVKEQYFKTCGTCGVHRDNRFLYECDICGHGTCVDHSRFTEFLPRQFWGHAHDVDAVRVVCEDCAATAELKFIHDCPMEDLPTIMDTDLATEQGREYLFYRMTTGKTRELFCGQMLSRIVYLRKMILEEDRKEREKQCSQ